MVGRSGFAGPALAVALAAALASCAPVGPEYRVPEQAVVKAPQAQGAFLSGGGKVVNAPLPDHWWRLYDDPALDRLVEQALAANTDLRAADAHLARAQALLREAQTRRQVQAGFGAATSREQLSGEAFLQSAQPPMFTLYDIGAGASYDLDLFGGLRRGIEAASADSEAAVAARDLVRVTVAAETARAYADLCNANWQSRALQRVIDVEARNVALVRETASHGRAAAFEAQKPDVVLEASRARLPGLTARARNAAFRLAALMAKTPADADPALAGLGGNRCNRPLTLNRPLPTGDGRALLARRPDIRMAERRLAADTARIGLVTAALYPDIRLNASIGSTGVAQDALTPATNRYAMGPITVDWPINRAPIRARIRAARAQADADLAQFDGAVLTALREVETALTRYDADLARRAELARARDAAQEVAVRTRQLRAGGRVGGIAEVQAEQGAALAEQALAESDADIDADRIAVFLALGGGWGGGCGDC